jgi:Mce-associated membrane protein
MTVNDIEAKEAAEPEVDNASEVPVESDTGATTTPDAPAKPAEDAGDAGDADRPKTGPRSVSISLRGLVGAAVVAALVVAVGVFSWLYMDAKHQLDAQAARADNAAHAEKVALDYAVNAATMDFKDMQAWRVKLTAGTSPELSKKLSDAGTSMEQVLVPLQWSSSAQPLVAKVRSVNGGVYVVDSFVSVQTKTVQAPEALQSTATYSTTIDSNKNWQITDVGGIGSALGSK